MLAVSRTTTALLDGLLRGDDDAAWTEFAERYRPIIVAFGRHVGLGAADAEDAAQDTLVQFLQAYRAGKYDRARGRLRSWIIGIAKYRVADIQRRCGEAPAGSCASGLADQEDEKRLSQIWEAEHRREILRQAIRRVKEVARLDPQTIEAFERLALRHETPATVAAALKLTLNDVYVAKHRALARLRDMIREIEGEYDDSLP
jgi:RNA polymerase sigma factor (sigma-70 family)